MRREIFLDTSYAIALSNMVNKYHKRAVELSKYVTTTNLRLVTSRAVLLEIGNGLSQMKYRQAAAKLLVDFELDSNVEIIDLTHSLYLEGLNLFRQRPDKEWRLVDCISFVVMQKRHISDAFTADEHFTQAGFNALLR